VATRFVWNAFVALSNSYSHPGCQCPDAYHGIHCELLKTVRPGQNGPRVKLEEPAGDAALLFTMTILVVVVLTLAGVIYYRLRYRGRYKNQVYEDNYTITSGPSERIRLNQSATGVNMAEEMEFSESESEMEEIQLDIY
jgi:hypothetical protein